MSITMHATKLVVRDSDASERFYAAIGMKLVRRNVGGDGEFAQRQSWLSATGDATSHILILSQFPGCPPPKTPPYPGEVWLAFQVPDVDATCATVTGAGGAIVRPGEDRPEHSVRAAVVSDPEGHVIELVGPLSMR